MTLKCVSEVCVRLCSALCEVVRRMSRSLQLGQNTREGLNLKKLGDLAESPCELFQQLFVTVCANQPLKCRLILHCHFPIKKPLYSSQNHLFIKLWKDLLPSYQYCWESVFSLQALQTIRETVAEYLFCVHNIAKPTQASNFQS